MHLASVLLRAASPLAVIALLACQAAAPPIPTTPAPVDRPTPTPERSASLPTGENVTLGSITDTTVLVDQVGYLSTLPKTGLVVGGAGSTFQVVDSHTSRSVFAAQLGDATRDPDTGLTLRQADF